jgi:hypothetical protein
MSIKKLILILVVVFIVAGIGITIYANVFTFSGPDSTGGNIVPKQQDAIYQVVITNTQKVYFTNLYNLTGKVYILHGYYELVGKAYVFRNRDLILDQTIYGPISVLPRPKAAQ